VVEKLKETKEAVKQCSEEKTKKNYRVMSLRAGRVNKKRIPSGVKNPAHGTDRGLVSLKEKRKVLLGKKNLPVKRGEGPRNKNRKRPRVLTMPTAKRGSFRSVSGAGRKKKTSFHRGLSGGKRLSEEKLFL